MKISELLNEDWNKVNKQDKTDGLSQKAVNAYRRENPGSKLKTAVTTKPSKLKAGSKASKRRKSFCARMSGNKGPMKKPNGKPTPKALALRRWNCESVEEMVDMIIENMDHAKDNQAVPELKSALLAKKTTLQNASEDDVYDIIDTIMTRIAKSHGMSGQKLHDMWVKEYDQIPDTWIMKDNRIFMKINELLTETTWQDIYKLNRNQLPGGPDRLEIGRDLEMPDGSFYTVAAGDTLSKIAAGQGRGKRYRETAKGMELIDPRDAQGARRGSRTDAPITPAPVTQAKQGPAPDGSVLKAAVIPWAQTYPQFAGQDMIKTKGVWYIKGGTASQYAKEKPFIAQLEQLWAQQP